MRLCISELESIATMFHPGYPSPFIVHAAPPPYQPPPTAASTTEQPAALVHFITTLTTEHLGTIHAKHIGKAPDGKIARFEAVKKFFSGLIAPSVLSMLENCLDKAAIITHLKRTKKAFGTIKTIESWDKAKLLAQLGQEQTPGPLKKKKTAAKEITKKPPKLGKTKSPSAKPKKPKAKKPADSATKVVVHVHHFN